MTDVNLSAWALSSTAVATALFHTLIPDHWLPFVLIGRARSWPPGKTALVSGVSAAIHALVSVLLGLAGLGLGVSAAALVGETLERASTVLLIVFGATYAAWAWRKGGHFHPGGERLHGGEADSPCPGTEGDAHPEHLHYHADENLILGRTGLGAWSLALIVGANPCILLFPLLLSSVENGTAAVLWTAAAYVVPTVVIMVGLSVLGVYAGRDIFVPRFARHMEAASGLLVALLGLALLLLH